MKASGIVFFVALLAGCATSQPEKVETRTVQTSHHDNSSGAPSVAGTQAKPGEIHTVVIQPKHGQTADQLKKDRYDCFASAKEETGFDPTALASNPPPSELKAFNDAQASCLKDRGYDVKTS